MNIIKKVFYGVGVLFLCVLALVGLSVFAALLFNIDIATIVIDIAQQYSGEVR